MNKKQKRIFLSTIGIILILFVMGTAHVWDIASDYEQQYIARQEALT